ncbi:DedA family protein [Tianweitania sp. BSSL-BM11]|uniref:DedA family protein n=1 Tax=Tianweitania aestuarii TaxID=2814886 RepID=A0ABS5RUR0_9HYPH|nr:DedA family protein [Tianweitania aestuarii]MBS9720739.1 DedA family protein [Tianweitania aestuarii]
MIDAIDTFVREYGVLAVFAGSAAEGESVAIVGGFFAHQMLLPLWQTYLAALVGTFVGDTAYYVFGKRFADHRWVQKMRTKPGFSHAMRLAQTRPRAFVFLNRYAYGLRLLGGVCCGLAKIDWGTFLIYNLLSSIVWATVFVGIGYFFGLGVEALIGDALHDHQRVIIAVAIVLAVSLLAAIVVRKVMAREKQSES